MKKTKDEGKSKEDMSVKELKELALSLGLIKEDDKVSKKELLEKIDAFEKARLDDKDAPGLKKVVDSAPVASEVRNKTPFLGMHEGKKVISKKDVPGTEYVDITVEGGITYRVSK